MGSVAMWKAMTILFWAVGAHAYFWDLEFGLHTSLRKGAALNAQTGAYLKDSWRTEVIVPTIADLKEKMKQLYRSNLTQDLCFGGSILVFGGMTILGLILGRKKVTKRVKQENEV